LIDSIDYPSFASGFGESDLGVIITNESGIIRYANEIIKKFFDDFTGHAPGESFDVSDLIYEEDLIDDWITLKLRSEYYLMKKLNVAVGGEACDIHFIFDVDRLISKLPKHSLYKRTQDEIQSIIDCIHDGIYITDGTGCTLMINKASKEFGLSIPILDDMIGRNVREFVEKGYWDESITLQVLEAKKTISRMQTIGGNKELLTTGVPYFENGKITKVVTTEREVTDLINLRKQLQEKTQMTQAYQCELEYYRTQITSGGDLVYESTEMQKTIDSALKAARQDVTVLIQGESGTGKEVIANYIYHNSLRKDRPFIKINCASIPESLLESEFFGYEKGAFTGANKDGKIGIFELANHGTLFLDEITEIPIHIQSKLLRAIQENEIMRIGGIKSISIDVRIIAATNIDLKRAVDEGLFRGDLYYRLNIFPIIIPPLRNRKDDVRALAAYFIKEFNKKYKVNKTLDTEAMDVFSNYDWPGNVRELKNVIERIVISIETDHINSQHVISQLQVEPMTHEFISNSDSLAGQVDDFEKNLIKRALEQHQTVSGAARALKVSKSTVSKKCKKYGIKLGV